MGLVELLVQTKFNGNKLLPGELIEVPAEVGTRWLKNNIAKEVEATVVPAVEDEDVNNEETDLDIDEVDETEDDLDEEETEEDSNEETDVISLEEMSIPELVKFAKEKEVNISLIPKHDRKDQTKVLAYIKAALEVVEE